MCVCFLLLGYLRHLKEQLQKAAQVLLVLACLWILLTRHPVLGADLQINQFAAYDCSQPYDVKDVGYAVATNCITNNRITNHRNVSYQVLQKERFRKAQGWKCSIDKSQLVHYCGAFDHQTMYPDKTYFNMPFEVTGDLCYNMWTTLTYTDPTGYPHKLVRNAITNVHYEEQGYSWLDSGEVKCDGEDYKIPEISQIIKEAMVSITLKITLREESFQYNEDGVTAHTTQTRLPCPVIHTQCSTPEATYGWVMPADSCELALTTDSTGLEATNSADQVVFMSHDGTQIRFIVREGTSMCGRTVYETNIPGWYLYPTHNVKQFSRKVDPSAMSPMTAMKNKDDFLFNYLANAIQDEFENVIVSDCKKQMELSKLSYWIQHKNPGATTWLIGQGIFGTGNGEVIYQYRCLPVMVMARETTQCYQALPVERLETVRVSKMTTSTETPKDKEAFGQEILEDNRPLFMEPLTRRLTHEGIEVPCVSKFAAKYRNINEGWISHQRSVHGVAAPQLPSDIEERISALDPRIRPQAASGGVYKQEDIDAMEAYMDLPRATTALGTNLVNQAIIDHHRSGPLRPENLFPTYQDPRQWMSGLWGSVVAFLHEWGEAASVLISLYIIIKLGITIFGWCYNLFILRDIHGCGRILCWIPFVSFFLMKTYRDSPYGMQEREDRAQRKNRKVQEQLLAKKREEPPEGYISLGQVASPNAYSNLDDIAPVAAPRELPAQPCEDISISNPSTNKIYPDM
jgi:hypothetical protein